MWAVPRISQTRLATLDQHESCTFFHQPIFLWLVLWPVRSAKNRSSWGYFTVRLLTNTRQTQQALKLTNQLQTNPVALTVPKRKAVSPVP
jgi:hypothetical protein